MATLDDAEQVTAWEAQFPSDRLSRRSVRRLIRSPSAQVYVAEGDDGLLGNLVVLTRKRARSARLYSLFVAPRARGHRIAEQLLEAAERNARKLGLAKVTLEVRLDAAAAHRVYARCGYRTVRELSEYYDDGADGLRLEKALD